jgi:hypothetical protein
MSKTVKTKALTTQQKNLLKQKYYNEKNYFGRDKLFNLLKNEPNAPTKQQVGDWLKTQQVHQLHLKQKKSTVIKPVIVKTPSSLYEIDLIDMGDDQDEKARYILTLIDVFSRFAYAQLLKKKDAKSVLQAFKVILKDIDKITVLQSDNGSEFIDANFKKFLAQKKIKHILTIPGKPQSNGVIERFNGTLKSMLHKDITATLNNEWSDNLQTYIDNYNNSYHETIKMTPVEAKINTGDALKNVQLQATKHTGRKYQDIKVGDLVRKKIFKGKLEKHSKRNWTNDTYKIFKIVQPQKPYNSTKYYLEDDNKPYSRNDIQLVKEIKLPPKSIREIPDQEYEVEKILDKKMENRRVKYLVRWRGYDNPTWESYANVKDTMAYNDYLKKHKK